MIQFVPLHSDHLDWISQTEKEFGDVRWSRAQFESELRSAISRFFIVEDDGQRCGYAGYWTVQGEAQITNMLVVPGRRRQGLGKQLLNYLITNAQADGCRIMRLEVRAANAAAQRLYAAVGFLVTARRPRFYTDPADDALFMEKVL